MNRLHLLPALPVLAFVLTGAVAPPARILIGVTDRVSR